MPVTVEPMKTIILYRNTENGKIGFVTDEDGESIKVWPSYQAALADVPNVPILRAYPHELIEFDL